jgi:hypothetical protein
MADLLAFPQGRNVGKARHVAALWMQRRPGRQRDSYWATVCQRLRGVLERVGFDESEIDKQVGDFAATVNDQVHAIEQRAAQHRQDVDFALAHSILDDASEVSTEVHGPPGRRVTPRQVTTPEPTLIKPQEQT